MDVELERTRKLIEAARVGRREAYDELFRVHQAALTRGIRTRFPGKLGRRIEPADVIQDTLVDAVRHFEDFDYRGPGSFRGWLLRLMENRMRTLLAHHFASERRSADLERPLVQTGETTGTPGERLVDSASSPSAAAAARERRETIERALRDLPPDYREVIRWIKLDGWTVADAAHAMGRSENAVRKLLTRALLKLGGDLSGADGSARR